MILTINMTFYTLFSKNDLWKIIDNFKDFCYFILWLMFQILAGKVVKLKICLTLLN